MNQKPEKSQYHFSTIYDPQARVAPWTPIKGSARHSTTHTPTPAMDASDDRSLSIFLRTTSTEDQAPHQPDPQYQTLGRNATRQQGPLVSPPLHPQNQNGESMKDRAE